MLVALSALGGCKGAPPEGGATATAADADESPLAGTEWQLVEFRSMSDEVGTIRPEDPSDFTMTLNADGTVAMTLDCNQASGTWSTEPVDDGDSGSLRFGLLATTRAACPPPHLDERIAADAEYVRSYLIEDGLLYVSLMADGGIYVWEPLPGDDAVIPPDGRSDALEAAIRDAEPDYTAEVVASDLGEGRYVQRRADLNDDGRDEVVVLLMGSVFCGTGGCDLLLLTEGDDGYALVERFPTSRAPVIASPEATDGWSDLIVLQSGGGMEAEYVRYAWDGEGYAEVARLPADEVPEGTLLIDGDESYDAATPLPPPG